MPVNLPPHVTSVEGEIQRAKMNITLKLTVLLIAVYFMSVNQDYLPVLSRLIWDIMALKPGKLPTSLVTIVTSITFRDEMKVGSSLGE